MKKTILMCLILLLTFGFAGCGAQEPQPAEGELSDEVQTITVARPGLDIKIATIIVADGMGYYEEEGVNVAFEQVADLATGLTAVSTGDIDVLPFGCIPTCSFVSQGTDVVVFGGTIAEGSEALIRAEDAGKYVDAEDFIGTKIACFRMETGHMVMKGWLREQGLDVNNDVEWIYMDSMASIAEAVQKGEVDLGFVNSGYGFVATKDTSLAVGFQVGEYVENFPCCRQTTSRDALTEKHDGLVKFTIANLRAYETILKDKEASIAVLADYSGQPAEYVENVIYGTDTYDAAMIVSLDPSAVAVEAFYETMKANGDIDAATTYDMADYVDTEIYGTALSVLAERESDNALWAELKEQYSVNN